MIVDCVTFFNEADLLDLRFCELDPVVDLFVVVEGDRTHAGAPKESHLPRDLVLRWKHKLVVHTATLPAGEGQTWTWRREMMQRNAINDALARLHCAHDDMILISDCDEIPRRQFVASLWQIPNDAIAVAEQRLHYYSVNHIARNTTWYGTRATQYGNVVALGADNVRYAGSERGGFPRRLLVRDAGWHLSYLGDATKIRTKITSFLHQEYNAPEYIDEEAIAQRIAEGRDVYDREEQSFDIDYARDLPSAMYERPMRWARFFYEPYTPIFIERWSSDEQTALLARLAAHAPPDGAIVEIGSWQGASTIAIAHGAQRHVVAIDTWRGSITEGDDHPTVVAARERDVYAEFAHNIRAYGVEERIIVLRDDWRNALANLDASIAFCFLDAAHDEESVRAQIATVLPRLVPGGVLCGDDFYAPSVRAAVTSLLDNVATDGRMWWWRRDDGD